MKIAVSYNRPGRKLAQSVVNCIALLDHEVVDLGIDADDDEFDSTDGVYQAANVMLKRGYDRLILIYGAGLAASMAANKIKGIYAAPCHDVFEARLARSLYNVNCLCLAHRWLDIETARAVVEEWLKTPFHPNVRRSRALRKLMAIEQGLNPADITVPEPVTAATPG